MSDKYFTDFQSIDYAEHFLAEALKLVALSDLVNVAQLREAITLSKERIEAELGRAGITRSNRRTGSGSVKEATASGRRTVRKFFKYLGTVDVSIDMAAFFPGERLGLVSTLKPADVKIKIDEVLKGFEVPLHAQLPDGDKWKQRLMEARQQLAEAVEGREEARANSIRGTATLLTMREDFLTLYNGVAKPLVRGLLTSLGRKNEMALFFKDLQVSDNQPAQEEDGGGTPPKKTPPGPGPTSDPPKTPKAERQEASAASAPSPEADKRGKKKAAAAGKAPKGKSERPASGDGSSS